MSEARVGIVGGGVAGCAAAIALCRAGVDDVLILEGGAADRPRVGETIPPDARRLLGLLGVGADLEPEVYCPCHGSASSWGADELGYNDHFVHPLGVGWHLDRARFDAWLAREADRAGARWRRDARLVGLTRQDGGFLLELEGAGGPGLRVDLLIDASGAGAAVGRRLGSRSLDHDRLIYLSQEIAPDPGVAPSSQTWLEATAEGWWYAAQLPSGRWTVAVATDPDRVRERDLHRATGWWAALRETRHLHARLGRPAAGALDPQAWVARSSLLGPPAGAGWLAVGDAAATWDPICARGIYKALEDGQRAAEAVRDTLAGDPEAIGRYARHTILSFRTYLEQRAWLYARETRWPDAPFWSRRNARRNLVGP